MIWWILGGALAIVIAIVGGGVVLAHSALTYDPTDTEEPEDEQ